MNTFALQQPAVASARPGQLPLIALAVALAALADFLLYGQPTGIGWALLAAAVCVAIFYRMGGVTGWRAAAALLAIAPLVENVSGLSLAVSGAGLAAIALSCSKRLSGSLERRFLQVITFGLQAPFRLIGDLRVIRRLKGRLKRRAQRVRGAQLLVWVMPVALGLVFLWLFAVANPVVQDVLLRLDLFFFLPRIELARICFWLIAIAGAWAFLRPRFSRPTRKKTRKSAVAETTARTSAPDPGKVPAGRLQTNASLTDIVFGRAALLRALLLFNAMFALQSLLDLAYLWGGVALPDHLTYAEYAHRGAYPLIVTALLAAGFVLLALKPGSDTEADRTIRWLVYLWIGQNVLLVISSMLRLDLYVSVYSLTYWRIAAFLWMALVGVGLVLIIARIKTRRSAEWLTSANLLALMVLAYASCFINFAAIIANWNVDHSREMTGTGMSLDRAYLHRLGPQAAPALARIEEANAAPCYDHSGQLVNRYRLPMQPDGGSYQSCSVYSQADPNVMIALIRAFRHDMTNWRAWTLRNLRLQHSLAILQK